MSTHEHQADDNHWRLNFLFQAITNSQDIIRASESRVPVALVLHGLLFAGLTAVTLRIPPIIDELLVAKVLTVILLAAIFVSFLISVVALIACIFPHYEMTPVVTIPKEINTSVFFPTVAASLRLSRIFDSAVEGLLRLLVAGSYPKQRDRSGGPRGHAVAEVDLETASFPNYEELKEVIRKLDRPGAIDVLAAELLVISGVRERKTLLSKVGFIWLASEIMVSLLYLAMLGASYLSLHW